MRKDTKYHNKKYLLLLSLILFLFNFLIFFHMCELSCFLADLEAYTTNQSSKLYVNECQVRYVEAM